jgi:hypothetical protein
VPPTPRTATAASVGRMIRFLRSLVMFMRETFSSAGVRVGWTSVRRCG